MFANLADDLSIMLAEKNIIKPENRDFYFYGLQLAISKAFFFLVILIVSLCTKTLFVSMLFVLMYSKIRKYSGGHHCQSEVSCFFVSILLYLMMLLFYDMNTHNGKVFLCISASISIIIIMIFSPIEHKNKPLSIKERKKYGIISKVTAVVLIIIVYISLSFDINVLFYASSYALTADAVLILFALKEVKHNEYDS